MTPLSVRQAVTLVEVLDWVCAVAWAVLSIVAADSHRGLSLVLADILVAMLFARCAIYQRLRRGVTPTKEGP